MTAAPDHEVAADLGISMSRVRVLRTDGCKSARTVACSHDLAA